MAGVAVRNLVRWRQPGGETLGVVTRMDGRSVVVRLDEGGERTFAWPSEVLERLELPAGQHVRVLASGAVGVVGATRAHNGILLYQVHLPGGQSPTIMEDGVRPAVLTDPIERLRAGELHGARSTNLRLAATRLLFAYQHDELSTLGNSRVEIKAHQVGVVHRVAESYPHRFILADEVGLGKTIEAGLLIRELLARGVASRVLIVAPSGLMGQWQQEMKTKFNLGFSPFTREMVDLLRRDNPGENPWMKRDLVLTSATFASWTEDRRREIAGAGWDMVVFDEAHHCRRRYEGVNRSAPTNLYRLAEEISDPDLARAQAMLLLTATPMALHPFELYSLIELLDPALFPTFADFEENRSALRGLNATVEGIRRAGDNGSMAPSVLEQASAWLDREPAEVAARLATDRQALISDLESRHRLSQAMVRNRKSVVGGFMPRVAATWEVELTPAERDAYWAMTDYVRTGYARSRAANNNALGFLMATFQKLNASSSHALKRSIIRRIERLESGAAGAAADIPEEVVLDEAPTAEALEALLAARLDADWEEVRDLERIVALLDGIELDSKTRVLTDRLAELAAADPEAKVIVFTQFRDTQDYLRDAIGAPWAIHLFHGSLKPQEKDAAVARFRDGQGPQLLISTEAGGEGRNFQFCHVVVNYDLPWNPMKVEQRIGRVDRIGQPEVVTVFNLCTLGTIEERVVSVLRDRIRVFTETVGGLDPILGDVESDLRAIFLLAEAEARRRLQELEAGIERRVADARAAEERLADLIMDTRSFRREEVDALVNRPRAVDPGHLKRFVLGALHEMGTDIERDVDAPGVFRVRLGAGYEHRFPEEVRVGGRHRRVTFDLEVALAREEVDFLAFGHPIVDGLVEHVRGDDYGGVTSHRVVLSDEVPATTGWFFVYVIELGGLATHRELLPVFIGPDGASDHDLATWLLERAMAGRREEFPPSPALPPRDADFDAAVAVAEGEAVTRLLDRQAEVEAGNLRRLDRERTKRERSYDYRVRAADDKLAATRRIVERLSASDDEADRRILPVWQKNAEVAARTVDGLARERERRLAELDGRDRVIAQHELFSASYVSIESDPRPLLDALRADLSPETYELFARKCSRADGAAIAARRPLVETRRAQLVAHSRRHRFDVRLAVGIADALIAAIDGAERHPGSELALLNGAIGYPRAGGREARRRRPARLRRRRPGGAWRARGDRPRRPGRDDRRAGAGRDGSVGPDVHRPARSFHRRQRRPTREGREPVARPAYPHEQRAKL
jgi:SNF2 family DNA or RNA helicase